MTPNLARQAAEIRGSWLTRRAAGSLKIIKIVNFYFFSKNKKI
jgi:hypothetical protein